MNDYDDEPEPTTEEVNAMIQRAERRYHCDYETAKCFVGFKLDGYSTEQAKIMSGLGDPAY
jgi:hypothetical protein